MKLIFALSIAAAVAFSTCVQAQPHAFMTGPGTASCALFAQEYAKDVSVELDYFSWAEGFMSGLNVVNYANGRGSSNLLVSPVQDQMIYLRNYCSSNPLTLYSVAVTLLYATFPKIKDEPK